MNGKRLLLVANFVIAITILVVLVTRIDLTATVHQLARVGFAGAAAVLLDMTLALLGPILAWHILMRSEGIHPRLPATLVSGLMGHAVNLIGPMMYFGGEGVRTLHIARVTGTPRRRALATVVAGEFQQLNALSATIIASLVVVVGGRNTSPEMPISWMIAGAASLATIVALILSVVLLDLRLLAKAIGLLMRCGFFPGRLAFLREAVADTEEVVRSLLVRHKLSFLASQLVIFLSPLAQFILPAIFSWFLRAAGENVQQPS
jgi:Lysylphosphatidylglycerol synthase TM region